MQKKCDLYFYNVVDSDRLKFIELFDKNFLHEESKIYSGYLHIAVDRVKLVSVVRDLRSNGTDCFSVPIEYRDQKNISIDQALALAAAYAKTIGASAISSNRHQKVPPVFWCFDLACRNVAAEKAGGMVMIDRLDGHIWNESEYEEYFYDYNNVL